MPVELILKTKVEGLGAEADIVTVKPGYARNFLIPKNFAAPATTATKRQVEELKRKRAEREAEELNHAQEISGKLGKLKLTFTMVSGQGQEKVFGSVTAQDIATKLKEAGHEIDKRKIQIAKPIKDTGDHEVVIDLGHGIQGKINVEVISAAAKEKADAEEADARPARKPKAKRAEKA